MKKVVRTLVLVTILFLIFFLFDNCNGNGQEIKKEAEMEINVAKPPQVDIQVNKKYDDEGNLVGFDSTYSYYYSSIDGDSIQMDSMLRSFDAFFYENYPGMFNSHFDQLFFNDSSVQKDFFYEDFFQKRYELNNQYFNRMMMEMDSLKNSFFLQHQNPILLKNN